MPIKKTPKQKIKKHKGFTLIELIVTVAILGIFLAVGVPGLQSLFGNVSQNESANKLLNSLAYARGEAVTRPANVSVAALGGGRVGWNVFIDANADCELDAEVPAVAGVGGLPGTSAIPAEEILRVFDITVDNVQITFDDSVPLTNVDCVGFNEQGERTLPTTDTTITVDSIKASSNSAIISISPSGYAAIN